MSVSPGYAFDWNLDTQPLQLRTSKPLDSGEDTAISLALIYNNHWLEDNRIWLEITFKNPLKFNVRNCPLEKVAKLPSEIQSDSIHIWSLTKTSSELEVRLDSHVVFKTTKTEMTTSSERTVCNDFWENPTVRVKIMETSKIDTATEEIRAKISGEN